MMGPWAILPFLKGWDYHPYVIPMTPVTKNVWKPLKLIERPGWLITISLVTNDAYGTLRVQYEGSGGLRLTGIFEPETEYVWGAVQQDPSGWIVRYYRPIPASTAGLYWWVLTPGWQGNPLPYVGQVRIHGTLGALSTQSVALLAANAGVIEIIDETSFKKSLRRVLGTEEMVEALGGLR